MYAYLYIYIWIYLCICSWSCICSCLSFYFSICLNQQKIKYALLVKVPMIISPPWPDPTFGGLKPGLVEKFAAAKTDAEKPHTQLASGSNSSCLILDTGWCPEVSESEGVHHGPDPGISPSWKLVCWVPWANWNKEYHIGSRNCSLAPSFVAPECIRYTYMGTIWKLCQGTVSVNISLYSDKPCYKNYKPISLAGKRRRSRRVCMLKSLSVTLKPCTAHRKTGHGWNQQ